GCTPLIFAPSLTVGFLQLTSAYSRRRRLAACATNSPLLMNAVFNPQSPQEKFGRCSADCLRLAGTPQTGQSAVHHSSFLLSHARAIFQSRSTVAWPIPSTSAVSSMDSP